jgi:methyl-accepting chemotaxis protein
MSGSNYTTEASTVSARFGNPAQPLGVPGPAPSGTWESTKSSRHGTSNLEKSGSDLRWLLRTAEDAINGLVNAFQDLAGHTETTLTLAAAIVDRVEDESVVSVLPGVRALGIEARQFLGERLQATSEILETVTAQMELLHQLSTVTDGQDQIALNINMLTVHTKIEVAHLGSVGTGFEYLARELADFSQALTRNTKELASHTDDRRAATEKTKHMLAVELPHLREELARVEANLSDDLARLDAGLTKLSGMPEQFRVSAEEIARQIAGVVVAVQGYDITRQQIEHVQETLEVISHQYLGKDDARARVSPETACAHAGLAIQSCQLDAIKATFSEWKSQIRTCLESIFRISASDIVGIGPLVLEQERSMSAQLSHIDLLERECQAYAASIRSTLDGVSSLSQLFTEHLRNAESARNRLRLLTFNSVIEASRLGAQADTICVVADGIAEVSAEWNKIAEQSGSTLEKILDLTKRIGEVMATFSEASNEQLNSAQKQTKTGLESLRRASAFAVVQGQKIETAIETMRTRSGEIGKIGDLLDACFGRIDEVLSDIEQVKRQLEADDPDVKEEYDAAKIEELFSASYTTQTERDVLRSAIFGTAFSAAQQCSTGNDVELF